MSKYARHQLYLPYQVTLFVSCYYYGGGGRVWAGAKTSSPAHRGINPRKPKKKKKALNKTNTYVVINSICLQQKGQSRYFNPVAELAIPNDRSILYNPTKRGVLGILSVITLSSYSVQYQVLRSMAKSYMIKLA